MILLREIQKTPIIGDLISSIGYIFVRYTTPPVLWLSGYQSVAIGTSVVWITKNKKKAILDGIEFLRICDPEIYLRITQRQHFFVFYSHNMMVTNAFGRICGLHKQYIKLGVEGIAVFFVQSLFLLEASPSINQLKYSEPSQAALRKVLEWMGQHSFRPGLINAYSKVVDKWEQGR
jgi:hypothetical protein